MDLNSCATSRREACIESMQSIVWNPLQDGMESSRRKCTFGDAMRLRRYHTRLRVIPYQACGLSKYPPLKWGLYFALKCIDTGERSSATYFAYCTQASVIYSFSSFLFFISFFSFFLIDSNHCAKGS